MFKCIPKALEVADKKGSPGGEGIGQSYNQGRAQQIQSYLYKWCLMVTSFCEHGGWFLSMVHSMRSESQ